MSRDQLALVQNQDAFDEALADIGRLSEELSAASGDNAAALRNEISEKKLDLIEMVVEVLPDDYYVTNEALYFARMYNGLIKKIIGRGNE